MRSQLSSFALRSRRASSIKTRMLRREVGTNKKRRLLCQQAPLVGIRLALTQRTHEPCVPTKGYTSGYSYRFDTTRRVTILYGRTCVSAHMAYNALTRTGGHIGPPLQRATRLALTQRTPSDQILAVRPYIIVTRLALTGTGTLSLNTIRATLL